MKLHGAHTTGQGTGHLPRPQGFSWAPSGASLGSALVPWHTQNRQVLALHDRVYSLSAEETVPRAAISNTGQFQQPGKKALLKLN